VIGMSPGARKSVSPPQPRSHGRAPILVGTVALFVALGGPLPAGDSSNSRRAAGDGRGLATFGDRGLTSFGDRGLTTFGDRGLTSFSDIPLAPMGGLVPGGVAAPDGASNGGDRIHSSHSRCRSSGGSGAFVPLPTRESAVSFGSTFTDDFDFDDGSPLLMPRVELPLVVLDHRPALALVEATLENEIRRADEAGDSDLVRSLDADRR
jgi:hypothetical protein